MEIVGIVLICFFCICLILFFSFLTYFIYHKRSLFIKIAHNWEAKNEEFVKTELNKMDSHRIVTTKLKLESDEHACYYALCRVYANKLVAANQLGHSANVVKVEHGIDMGYNDERKMRDEQKKNIFLQEGYMFVTNRRLIIVNEELTTFFSLEQVINLELSILNIANHYYEGFITYFADKVYYVLCSDLKLPYYLKMMLDDLKRETK